jgi:hypothetical protein
MDNSGGEKTLTLKSEIANLPSKISTLTADGNQDWLAVDIFWRAVFWCQIAAPIGLFVSR